MDSIHVVKEITLIVQKKKEPFSTLIQYCYKLGLVWKKCWKSIRNCCKLQLVFKVRPVPFEFKDHLLAMNHSQK